MYSPLHQKLSFLPFGILTEHDLILWQLFTMVAISGTNAQSSTLLPTLGGYIGWLPNHKCRWHAPSPETSAYQPGRQMDEAGNLIISTSWNLDALAGFKRATDSCLKVNSKCTFGWQTS